MPEVVGRFAPSPTGRMHAGNIFSALMSWLVVKTAGGRIVLRIEDLDRERSKPQFIDGIMRDFEYLGLTWDEGPYFQHEHQQDYLDVFSDLQARDLIYPCFCSRADLHAASAPHLGEKYIYAGTCRELSVAEQDELAKTKSPAYRLKVPHETISFEDAILGTYTQDLEYECGDFVIRRSDGHFAYQLAVVIDDAQQGINCVVRGCDLLSSTPQQIYLQQLLSVPQPAYAHVPLIVNESGKRLSKRDRDASLDELEVTYGSPEAIVGHIAYVAGLQPDDVPASCEDLLARFTSESVIASLKGKTQLSWQA